MDAVKEIARLLTFTTETLNLQKNLCYYSARSRILKKGYTL